jgi:ADP-ribose pyrophosphatase YjhB (NUDIX family)
MLGAMLATTEHISPTYTQMSSDGKRGYSGTWFPQNVSAFNGAYKTRLFMTVEEKNNLKILTFDELWKNIWGHEMILNQYKIEEVISREKFNSLNKGIMNKNVFYTLSDLIDDSYKYECWSEPEWGFPKGRRNYQEKDFDCALREFSEETGYSVDVLRNVQNIIPYEEIFMGSNYKIYKHKYYLMYMDFENTTDTTKYETSEVSKMEWKPFEELGREKIIFGGGTSLDIKKRLPLRGKVIEIGENTKIIKFQA